MISLYLSGGDCGDGDGVGQGEGELQPTCRERQTGIESREGETHHGLPLACFFQHFHYYYYVLGGRDRGSVRLGKALNWAGTVRQPDTCMGGQAFFP